MIVEKFKIRKTTLPRDRYIWSWTGSWPTMNQKEARAAQEIKHQTTAYSGPLHLHTRVYQLQQKDRAT